MSINFNSAKNSTIKSSFGCWKVYLMYLVFLQLLFPIAIMCVPQPDIPGLDHQYTSIAKRSIQRRSKRGLLNKRTAPQPINQAHERFWRWLITFIKKHYAEINRRLQLDYQQNRNNNNQVYQNQGQNYQQQQGQNYQQQQQSPEQGQQQQPSYQQDQYQQGQDNQLQQQSPNLYIPQEPQKTVICSNVFIYVKAITISPPLADPANSGQNNEYYAQPQLITSLTTVTETITTISTVAETATINPVQTLYQSPPPPTILQASPTTVIVTQTTTDLFTTEPISSTVVAANYFNLELSTTSTYVETSASPISSILAVSDVATQLTPTITYVEPTITITTSSTSFVTL